MASQSRFLVLILTIGVFGIINTEMGVVGIIPIIAERFDVSVPTAGWTVSVFAIIVSLAAPILPMALSGINRRTIMLVTLALFTVSNLIALFSSSFGLLLFSRALPACLHPVYVAMAFTLAAQSTPDDPSKGIARIFVGVSAGMVLGVPFATWLTTHFGYEIAMSFFAFINLAALLATIFWVPPIPTKQSGFGTQIKVLKSQILWLSVIAFTGINGAMFGFFSYMSDFLIQVSELNFDAVSSVLLIYGLANIAGNMLAGKMFGKHRTFYIFATPAVMLGGYAALFALGKQWLASAGLLLALGVLAGFVNIVGQFLISSAARKAPDFANGLFLMAANLGTAFGTFFCGLFIASGDSRDALFGSWILLTLSLVCIAIRQTIAPRHGMS